MDRKHIERKYINEYITKHYKLDVENVKILSLLSGKVVYGNNVIQDIVDVFGFNKDRVTHYVKKWVTSSGIELDKVAINVHPLSESLDDDIIQYGIDVNEILSELLQNEFYQVLGTNAMNFIKYTQKD